MYRLLQRAFYLLLLTTSLATFVRADDAACRVAVRISVDNLRYRILSPSVDQSRVRRAFEELVVLNERCPRVRISQNAISENTEDDNAQCKNMRPVARTLDTIPSKFFAVYEKVTGCQLSSPREPSVVEPLRLSDLIDRTLREQKDSDGEGSYWIADDLLALLLVYPEEVVERVIANPSSHPLFISDLGGCAFDDLDDTPNSQHLVLREKMRVFAKLLGVLRKENRDIPERAKLVAEMGRACRCVH